MRISDCKVSGIDDALKCLGLSYGTELDTTRGERVLKSLLAKPLNSGEANVLTGINVRMRVQASIKWWQQAERYHWFQIAMSESVMHMIANPNIKITQDNFERVGCGDLGAPSPSPSPVIQSFIAYRDSLFDLYNGVSLPLSVKRELIYSVPVSLLEEAYVTTNYLQLMTMYKQRYNHTLDEWKVFCKHVYELPMMGELLEANGCYRPDTQLLSSIPRVCPDVSE